LIHTPNGPRPIEDIRVGDKVWAHDLVTGTSELQLVVETFVRHATELFHLTVNGERISTTAEHPFMVHERGWIDAAFLNVGDLLVTPEGSTVPVEAIETEQRTEADAETVYNFHVETHSNYYIYAGITPILVHNAGHSSLTQQADGTFKSPSGLVYGPDPSPSFASRVEHVQNHGADIPARPRHGVFDGDPIDLTEEAWVLAKNGSSVTMQQGQRTVHYVNMGRDVGYAGGQVGASVGNPPLSYIQMVMEGDKVITSFPASGIPMGA
jgi:hypothetical protein